MTSLMLFLGGLVMLPARFTFRHHPFVIAPGTAVSGGKDVKDVRTKQKKKNV